MKRVFLSPSPEVTAELAANLGRVLTAGAVLAVDGELGAGKTCFVHGLARGLEVFDPVSSPTYTLLHTYRGRLSLYHFDAWLAGRERAFLADGGCEWFDAGGVCVIEWAVRVADWLPAERLQVTLEHAAPSQRRLTLGVDGGGPAGARLEQLLAALELPEGLEEIL